MRAGWGQWRGSPMRISRARAARRREGRPI
jgi:hypothetical protein